MPDIQKYRKPTEKQERVLQIITKNAGISLYKALILAGYSKNTALNPTANVMGAKGMASLQDLYKFEIVKKGITPKFLAKKLKEGLKDKDKKTSLAYLQEVQKALELSTDTPDVAIQVNLSSDLEEYAK